MLAKRIKSKEQTEWKIEEHAITITFNTILYQMHYSKLDNQIKNLKTAWHYSN